MIQIWWPSHGQPCSQGLFGFKALGTRLANGIYLLLIKTEQVWVNEGDFMPIPCVIGHSHRMGLIGYDISLSHDNEHKAGLCEILMKVIIWTKININIDHVQSFGMIFDFFRPQFSRSDKKQWVESRMAARWMLKLQRSGNQNDEILRLARTARKDCTCP